MPVAWTACPVLAAAAASAVTWLWTLFDTTVQATGTGQIPRTIYSHALALGFSRGFLVSAGIAVIALVLSVVAIRVKKEDLAGDPMAAATGATSSARDLDDLDFEPSQA